MTDIKNLTKAEITIAVKSILPDFEARKQRYELTQLGDDNAMIEGFDRKDNIHSFLKDYVTFDDVDECQFISATKFADLVNHIDANKKYMNLDTDNLLNFDEYEFNTADTIETYLSDNFFLALADAKKPEVKQVIDIKNYLATPARQRVLEDIEIDIDDDKLKEFATALRGINTTDLLELLISKNTDYDTIEKVLNAYDPKLNVLGELLKIDPRQAYNLEDYPAILKEAITDHTTPGQAYLNMETFNKSIKTLTSLKSRDGLEALFDSENEAFKELVRFEPDGVFSALKTALKDGKVKKILGDNFESTLEWIGDEIGGKKGAQFDNLIHKEEVSKTTPRVNSRNYKKQEEQKEEHEDQHEEKSDKIAPKNQNANLEKSDSKSTLAIVATAVAVAALGGLIAAVAGFAAPAIALGVVIGGACGVGGGFIATKLTESSPTTNVEKSGFKDNSPNNQDISHGVERRTDNAERVSNRRNDTSNDRGRY
ncbi:MAG: hypothetical protein HOM96_05005 [Rickettsiales bacterium]|nr:hypothetical protein [Rickettsiales bacterium]